MRHLVLLCSMILVCANAFAQEESIEVDNIASDNTVEVSKQLKAVREINGGTVFIVNYGDGFSNEMKGAFEYACKIIEEYLPPCLPITVDVEWGNTGSSQSGHVFSKVYTRSFDGFGFGKAENISSPMTKIKAVTLGEYIIDSNISFFNSIPNSSFFENTDDPDIRIVYNKFLKNDISFSLEGAPSNKYDFVSVVIRDLLKGLGFSNRMRKDPVQSKLKTLPSYLNDFERAIANERDSYNSETFFQEATSGSLDISSNIYSETPLNLYAPENWEDGVSLNYFIPNDTYAISNSLSYQFGRGTVVRDINDKYGEDIFNYLLGWHALFTVGTTVGNSASYEGNTQNFLPYSEPLETRTKTEIIDNSAKSIDRQTKSSGKSSLEAYLDKFHPGQGMLMDPAYIETTMSILKKDGTWDVVLRIINNRPNAVEEELKMENFEFHYEAEEYARTCDGYLRGRLTTGYTIHYGPAGYRPKEVYESKFYVLDYLPQKVELGIYRNTPVSIVEYNTSSVPVENPQKTVKFVFKNLEGVTSLVLEKRIPGNNLPIRIEIPNFRRGSYMVTFDKTVTTTFNVVSYNANGHSISEPLTFVGTFGQIDPIPLTVNVKGNQLLIPSEYFETIEGMDYQIMPINTFSAFPVQTGVMKDSQIDISVLNAGMYSIRFQSCGKTVCEAKFKK